ncbi:MAG: DDE-type integrase/transposase/recombinase [Phycisphaeraceae bacterium]|nr:DDE-type integrase/transposase/recombinase [Phycisphaeraceae bacterium]
MNKLSTADRVRIVSALVEGCSIRATSRMTGVAKGTVLKLLTDLGPVCAAYHDEHVVGLQAERVQCDELWAFCYAKDKNLPDRMRDEPGVGSIWTWTAIDADSKLIISYHAGKRDSEDAKTFMLDLAGRIVNRIQLSTDGHAAYLGAVAEAFGNNVDYAQLVKIYGDDRGTQARYSPGQCIGTRKIPVMGQSNAVDVCTSHVERNNLTIRMHMRRYTRLTNAFSKKLYNLQCAISIHFMYYNFCRVHSSLRVTPAMEAGIADHVWDIEELVGLLERVEAEQIEAGAMKRGPYKKKADSN